MKPSNLPDAYNLAQALIDEEKNKNIARARLQNFKQIIDEAEPFYLSRSVNQIVALGRQFRSNHMNSNIRAPP